MIYLILFIIITSVLLFMLFNSINSQILIKNPEKKKIKPARTDLTDIYKDISIQPYGCFSSLDEKFFLKQINPYTNRIDSGIIISENKISDIHDLINQVMDNGFDEYANKMFNKYSSNDKNIDIKEIATLGKLAGYNYLSIYKLNENNRGKIYLTYSPPMNDDLEFNYTQEEYNKNVAKPDLPDHTLTPKLNNYTNEKEKSVGKELSCGYPCLPNGKPLTFNEKGVTKQYMCGSVAFPDIKTPPRFSVYRITEQI